MATVKDPDELALKLETYVMQLRQVEAALKVDPAHVELLKIKADLNELIGLTKNLLTKKISDGTGTSSSSFKRAKLSSSRREDQDTSTCYKRTTTESTEVAFESSSSRVVVSPPSPPEDEEATQISASIINSCTMEIQNELENLGIKLQQEDMMYCAMFHYWRKLIAEMRRPNSLSEVLPLKVMAKLSRLRQVTDEEVKTIMLDENCMNLYNNDQPNTIAYIVNGGQTAFNKMVTSFCNRCAGRGHVARICTRLKNKKAVNDYYKTNHPEMMAKQQQRRRTNLKRNRMFRTSNDNMS